MGAVFGDAKRQFFAEIDVFLFPTKSESWGLVLNEAIAAGVPAISYNRGCTSMVIGNNEAGLLIEHHAPFAEPAALQVEKWMDDSVSYTRSSRAAFAQASRLKEEGQRSLDSFIQHIFSAD
jgi:glycosyltransferase involved in cell wall biosynthesis